MEPLTVHEGIAALMDRTNVDTDQIIPKQFLKRVSRTGYGAYLFYDWRFLENGSDNPDFELNKQAFKGASVLVAGDNFGCGSSREHAPWVFEVNDVHTVIAESYARIFRQNMFNCGMLAIELPKADIDALIALEKEANGDVEVDVDVQGQKVVARGNGREESFSFDVSPFDKALVDAGGWVEYADARY